MIINAAKLARLRFIDSMMDYYGWMNREHLADFFGIPVPQASKDLGDYQTEYPANTSYNASTKRFERNATYRRVLP